MTEIGGVVIACYHDMVMTMQAFHGGPSQPLWVSRNGIEEQT